MGSLRLDFLKGLGFTLCPPTRLEHIVQFLLRPSQESVLVLRLRIGLLVKQYGQPLESVSQDELYLIEIYRVQRNPKDEMPGR